MHSPILNDHLHHFNQFLCDWNVPEFLGEMAQSESTGGEMKQTSGVHNTLKKKKREKIQCPNWVEKISERYFYVEQKRK